MMDTATHASLSALLAVGACTLCTIAIDGLGIKSRICRRFRPCVRA